MTPLYLQTDVEESTWPVWPNVTVYDVTLIYSKSIVELKRYPYSPVFVDY